MGRLQAEEMSNAERRQEVELDQAVRWHLVHNHYPPIPQAWVPVVVDFIRKSRAGREPETVESPWGGQIPGCKLIEAMHLEDFLQETDDVDG